VKRKQRDVLGAAATKVAGGKSVKKQKEEALKSVIKTGKGVTVVGKKTAGSKASRKPLA
jgi:U3 small nucleolar RNA-associated protein MPP10